MICYDKTMKIVTAGLSFLDIDAYAGCVAYAELLQLQGKPAIAFSSAIWNESITQTIRSWNAPLSTDYVPAADDSFVVVDVSEPEFLEKVVDIDRVSEVIDHHVGYEAFWQERLGDKANIEFIGAACTQVFESWQSASSLDQMSELSARLLISGILDNTLNFKADVTTDRDKAAYEELRKIAHLPDDWTVRYFQECEDAIFADIEGALTNDTKIIGLQNFAGKIAFGQLVIWNAQRAVDDHRDVIEQTMAGHADNWFVNVVNIQDGESFFLSSGKNVDDWARSVLDASFENNLAVTGRLWLRKEIIRQDQLANQ